MRKLKLEELGRVNPEEFKQQEKLPVTVILDNVRSLNNVGSVFRTCDAFAIEKLLLCGITGKPPHRDINKTALGATESVAWEHFTSITEAVEKLKQQDYIIIGVEQTTESKQLHLLEFNKNNRYAFIFGNEVDGLSDEVLPLLDFALEIPQAGTKHSLNISVSAGVVLWEVFRRQLTVDSCQSSVVSG